MQQDFVWSDSDNTSVLCRTCAYWVDRANPNHPESGDCRRNPRPIKTMAYDWCGEWQPCHKPWPVPK